MIKIGDVSIDATVIASHDMIGNIEYPQVEIIVNELLTDEQYNALMSGSFDIVDTNGNIEGTWNGFTTPNGIVYKFCKTNESSMAIDEAIAILGGIND